MPATRSSRGRLFATTALLIIVAAAYGASLRNELVFDELIFMERDARVHTLDVGRIFLEPLWATSGQGGHAGVHQYYRPLQLLPLAVSYALFGNAAWPSHLLNLLLHCCNCLLVLSIFRYLLRDEGPAVAAALLFAAHPGYSESVLWASDVAGLGAACCTLAIVRLHLEPGDGRWYDWLPAPVLFLWGLLFKESGVLAPALLAVYDVAGAPDRGWRRLRRMAWRYFVLAPPFALYMILRLHALGGVVPGLTNVSLTRTDMLRNAVALLPQYVSTFLWPFNLNMYHDFNAIHGMATTPFVLGIGVLLAGATLFVLTVRAHRTAAFGLAWAATTAAPYLLIRWPQLNVFAERYLYLPAVGVFLALAYVASQVYARGTLSHWSRTAGAAATLALLALFVGTDVRRTYDWHDEVTLYEKTLTQSARAEPIRINLAVRLLALGRHDEGIALLKGLVAVNPSWPEAFYNLGLLYMAKGMDAEAIAALEEARRRGPTKGSTLLDLGYLHDRRGERDLAVQYYLRLVRREPKNADAWYNLAVVALELGQLDNARMAARQVLAAAPGDRQAHAILRRLDAVQSHAPLAAARDHAQTRGRCAAAKEAADAGHRRDAVVALEAAAWLDETSPLPHQYLANLYFLAGRLPAAVREQREALRRDPDNQLYRRNLASLEDALAAAAVGNAAER